MPKHRPPGVTSADRRLDRCPIEVCDPWMWTAINTWHSWSVFGGLPCAGAISDQPARLLEAIGIVESESRLVQAYRQERETERAKMRR